MGQKFHFNAHESTNLFVDCNKKFQIFQNSNFFKIKRSNRNKMEKNYEKTN